MKPYYEDDYVTLLQGDCIEVMRSLPDSSVDSIVTDPPYGLGFMGKKWDDVPPGVDFAVEALRVLKPGGHLLSFGGTRTWHRLAVAIEDAGFEIRDSIAWLYGSGFPKSMDISKAIDKAAGAAREVVGSKLAEKWRGWGTALKPAFEPIVVARKPLAGTVAANVLQHGTGALNINANRVPHASDADRVESVNKNRHADFGTEAGGNAVYGDFSMVEPKNYNGDAGRFPPNVLLDDSQAAALDAQTGDLPSGGRSFTLGNDGYGGGWGANDRSPHHSDSGGASRFFPTFRYEAKAGKAERPRVDDVQHPTVKPLALMEWLVRLVTPVGGTVLEPFAGSGTTVEAAIREGFTVIGIEREASYLPLITYRIARAHETLAAEREAVRAEAERAAANPTLFEVPS